MVDTTTAKFAGRLDSEVNGGTPKYAFFLSKLIRRPLYSFFYYNYFFFLLKGKQMMGFSFYIGLCCLGILITNPYLGGEDPKFNHDMENIANKAI